MTNYEKYVNIICGGEEMYSFLKKQKIENKIKKGEELEHISQETQIPITTLEKWKEEIEIREIILELIKENKFEEAKIELEKLNFNLATKLSLESLIANKRRRYKSRKRVIRKSFRRTAR